MRHTLSARGQLCGGSLRGGPLCGAQYGQYCPAHRQLRPVWAVPVDPAAHAGQSVCAREGHRRRAGSARLGYELCIAWFGPLGGPEQGRRVMCGHRGGRIVCGRRTDRALRAAVVGRGLQAAAVPAHGLGRVVGHRATAAAGQPRAVRERLRQLSGQSVPV